MNYILYNPKANNGNSNKTYRGWRNWDFQYLYTVFDSIRLTIINII